MELRERYVPTSTQHCSTTAAAAMLAKLYIECILCFWQVKWDKADHLAYLTKLADPTHNMGGLGLNLN